MVLHSLMPLTRYNADPFVAIQRALQRSFDDVWQNIPASPLTEAASMPVRLDVKEDEQSFQIDAELPGLTEKEVEVTFDDGLLTIRGEKKTQREEKKDTWHVIERSSGTLARQVSLPANVDANKIEAKFDKGVLHITLPKMPAEQNSAKKINIKSN